MRTLLVEDDATRREIVSTWLGELGLDVTAVEDSQEGLLAHLRSPFELLVLDWVTPRMDGLQLCQRIRALPTGEAPYILIVTGRDRPQDLLEALDAGADDYMAKPIDFNALRTRIRIAERRVANYNRRKAAEEALAQSEVDFRRVIERCPLGVFAHRDGRIVYVNNAATITFGMDRERLVGSALGSFVPDAYREVALERAARFERTNVPPPPMEMEILRPDGTRAPVRMIPTTRARLRGERASFVILEDVSERLRAGRELRLTRFAMDHAGDASIWVREDGRLIYGNHAAQELAGLLRAELVGRYIWEYDQDIGPDDWTEIRHQLELQTTLRREGTIRRKDGPNVPVEMSLALRHYDGEQLIIAVVRDVRERRLLQRSLQNADRLASVGSLAAGVAHEINNPLAYVIANLELLGEELDALQVPGFEDTIARLSKTVAEATDGANRVRRIVGDLKTFARATDDDDRGVDVADVLDTAIDIAANEIRHRARLERVYGNVPRVRGNEGRLTQVFLNLLVNAAHAIPEDGSPHHRIKVVTGLDDEGWVRVEISDTGVGIPGDMIDRIFDPFFTTKPQGMGTGLGLSICHGIVSAMGGRIEVESSVGSGSCFRLRLPVAQGVDAPEPVQRDDWRGGPRRTLRILVVDDEPLICEGIRRALAGHDVVTAKSGKEAIRLCENGDFDLILCDVMMPDVSGIDVYGRVRTAKPGFEARFVFMTGGAFTPKTRAFLESVDNEQITKPFSLGELRTLIARKAVD